MMINKYSFPGGSALLLSWFLILTLVFLSLFSVPVNSRSLIIDTKGYASGQLSRVGRQNMFNRALNTAYAGEVLLGHESASFISFGSLPQNLVTNPFQFCFEKEDFYETLEELIGYDVVIEYKTPRNNTLLSCTAINELVDVYLIDRNIPLEQLHLIGDIRTFEPEVSYGVEFGRITNVIKNENAVRSYFMTMQIGESGNKFRHFVMDDRDLYEFAIKSLRMAAMVKVYYSERLANRNIFGHRTRLFVSEIKIVKHRDVE
ncbi:hypothetical protein SAMN05216302_101350 [Nitrosomonas aestuarii]|uniref:Uncharacterized protein n=1 Tax=Nitrosomonas aestuarii TaxID=52441 RepID=A0A1I4BSR4_9PROT|nr:hypothetical protein [Nitrosomonas aestuarii]SFK71844.1 hypothetical protein SAMN05216302_101350 [Nitrosomonas aestuarii]